MKAGILLLHSRDKTAMLVPKRSDVGCNQRIVQTKYSEYCYKKIFIFALLYWSFSLLLGSEKCFLLTLSLFGWSQLLDGRPL